MVYVYETQRWEYKVVARSSDEDLPEAELNELGLAGWELAGIVTRSAQVHFYFKRVRK
jgi:hypothetical protein